MKNTEKTMDQIVALCKGRGFVYPGSEIYGGLANSWDYGPLGVELKNNVKRAWWKKFVQENPYNVGLDAAILMNPEVWVASGHVSTFNDPLIDCKACKMRHRADKLIEGWCAENGRDDVNVEAMTNEELVAFIRDNGVTCPGFVITTNRHITDWGVLLGDPTATSAILDRFLHHSCTLTINGDSYRLLEKKREGLVINQPPQLTTQS